jgi:hypothetical protein
MDCAAGYADLDARATEGPLVGAFSRIGRMTSPGLVFGRYRYRRMKKSLLAALAVLAALILPQAAVARYR